MTADFMLDTACGNDTHEYDILLVELCKVDQCKNKRRRHDRSELTLCDLHEKMMVGQTVDKVSDSMVKESVAVPKSMCDRERDRVRQGSWAVNNALCRSLGGTVRGQSDSLW